MYTENFAFTIHQQKIIRMFAFFRENVAQLFLFSFKHTFNVNNFVGETIFGRSNLRELSKSAVVFHLGNFVKNCLIQ